jgi:2-oxoglutarate ferredoxin oxidoreductase subunit beta
VVTSEVIIDKQRCRGCGYCMEFCPRGCLQTTGKFISQLGYAMPMLTKSEQCNTCGFCVEMCPHWAIEVNLLLEDQGEAVIRENIAGPPKLALTPPVANCSGCQRPTVGRIIAEVLEELAMGGEVIAIDAITCGGCSTFGVDFGYILGPYDSPIDIAIATKRANPKAVIIVVQDSCNRNNIALDSFICGLTFLDKITVISCNGPEYGPWPNNWHFPTTLNWITTPRGRELVEGEYPLHIAELAASLKGVAYSARGALTSPDDYQRTKSYIRTALQKQKDNVGSSFVEVLCACFPLTYDASLSCLKWIKDKMISEFPLGEFKNVYHID